MADDILRSLGKRKEQILSTLEIAIKVDHWDDDGDAPVYVAYGPVSDATIEAAQDASLAAKDNQAKLEANAQLLVEACRGVYQKVDGKRVGFDGKEGNLPKFDSALAKVLDMAGEPSPTMICRALFLVEGNLLAHAGEVAAFSGRKLAEVDTTLSGE